MTNNKGGIFLNVLISVLVIALTITISLPHVRTYRINAQLSSESRELVSDLRYAQQLAVTEQKVHGVEFDTINNLYNIVKLAPSTTTLKTVKFSDNSNLKQTVGLSDDRVEFNFYGGVDNSGQIYLENINNKQIVIEIKPSGYVQIK